MKPKPGRPPRAEHCERRDAGADVALAGGAALAAQRALNEAVFLSGTARAAGPGGRRARRPRGPARRLTGQIRRARERGAASQPQPSDPRARSPRGPRARHAECRSFTLKGSAGGAFRVPGFTPAVRSLCSPDNRACYRPPGREARGSTRRFGCARTFVRAQHRQGRVLDISALCHPVPRVGWLVAVARPRAPARA